MTFEEIIADIFQTQNQAIILRAAVNHNKRRIDTEIRSTIVRYVELLRENIEFSRTVDERLPDVLAEWTTKNSYDWMVLNSAEIEVKVVHYGGTDESAFVLPINYITDPEAFKRLNDRISEFVVQRAALTAATTRIEDEKFRQQRYNQYLKLKQEFEPK